MRKKMNIIIMGVMVVLALALVLTGCGKKEPHEETYDKMTNEVWSAVRSDDHGYRIEFWPDGVCYIISTYGENWTGVAKRDYTVSGETGQPVIGTGEFIVTMSDDEKTMNIVMPDGESWDFHLTDASLSSIDQGYKKYDELFKGMKGPQNNGGNNSSKPSDSTPSTTPSQNANITPNANGKYEYSISNGNFEFECDINVFDYIDSDNNFDIEAIMRDWGFDKINITVDKKMGTAESTTRNMAIIFNLDDRSNLNNYGLRPALYWMFVNKSFTVNIGTNHATDSMYTVKGHSPWGMSLDEIELFAYFMQYAASNKSDQYYMSNFGYNWKANEYWLP